MLRLKNVFVPCVAAAMLSHFFQDCADLDPIPIRANSQHLAHILRRHGVMVGLERKGTVRVHHSGLLDRRIEWLGRQWQQELALFLPGIADGLALTAYGSGIVRSAFV